MKVARKSQSNGDSLHTVIRIKQFLIIMKDLQSMLSDFQALDEKVHVNIPQHENGFARAFGGDGGTCECRGGCPPGPPLCW